MQTEKMAEPMMNPEEWQIRGQLRHGGVVYGRGEPLPVLTLQEAERYEAQGALARILPDGSLKPAPRRAAGPADAAAYLYAKDEQVLRSILEHRPSKRTLRQVLVLAKSGGRSYSLRFALEAILLYAGVKDPHADVQPE